MAEQKMAITFPRRSIIYLLLCLTGLPDRHPHLHPHGDLAEQPDDGGTVDENHGCPIPA